MSRDDVTPFAIVYQCRSVMHTAMRFDSVLSVVLLCRCTHYRNGRNAYISMCVCIHCVILLCYFQLFTEVEGQLLLSQCGSMKAVLCTHQRYVYVRVI
jgi:D-alanyl-lipoteichoic acid acyltransferase DltB (MBOAT superfamily)